MYYKLSDFNNKLMYIDLIKEKYIIKQVNTMSN
jgi:hypothetical protein